jgi:hypothetical protein
MPASAIVCDDAYCRIELRNSKRTIIAFSAINCPPGKFHGSRALHKADCNLVFLNCPRNSWYLDGIPGLGGSIGDAAQELRKRLDAFGLTKTRMIAWGGSMGGYGAVVFGSLLNVEAIVATGAEMELLIPGGNSELVLKTLQKRVDIESPAMDRVLAQGDARISLYAGEFFYPDLVSALQAADRPATQITTLRDFGHPLPGYLNDTYGLEKFILHHFDSNEPFPFQHDEVGCMAAYKEHWRMLHQVSLGGHQRDVEYITELAQTASDAEFRMHCHHALSMGASARGNHKLAAHEAEQAVRAWPQSCFAAYRYALALKNTGEQAGEWLEVAMGIPHIHQPDRFSESERLLKSMVTGFAEAGWNDRGIDFFQQLMYLPETTAATAKSLAASIQALSGQDAWQVGFDAKARAELSGFLIDRHLVLSRKGRVQISGVMIFPLDDEPTSFRGEGLAIEAMELRLASPGYRKKLPNHPLAGQSRFRMKVHMDNRDVASVYACWHDGRTMPILHFNRVTADAGVDISNAAPLQI